MNLFKILPLNYIYTDLKTNYIIKLKLKDLFSSIYILYKHQNFRFKVLSTISCTDFPELYNRFELTYILMSINFPLILNLKIKFREFNNVESLSSIYKSAVWLEREIWDLFGIYFKNNLDLRRILTDYGFLYHPLRKTFPLQGFDQLYYNLYNKKIFYRKNFFINIKPIKSFKNVWLNVV